MAHPAGTTPLTTPVPVAPRATWRGEVEETNGSVQILKSTALIGGSSLVTIGLGIVRTKALAVILGPGGVGLMGLYFSVIELAQSLAGLGIQSSGVRQIADAAGSQDRRRIARTATVLRWTSIVLGIVGASVLIALSGSLSQLTFGNREHAAAIALLSLAVFCRVVSGGQGALIQGLRRISDLARLTILGALFGTLITIPLVYYAGMRGVVPSLIAVAVVSTLTSWWYSRKVPYRNASMTPRELGHETSALLKLGFAFMASSVLTTVAAYLIRALVARTEGLEAAGLYQSAWTLGGLYVGFILQAMGTDFYPRLTAVANDHDECNRLVNEQAYVGLLLGGPGVLATLTFAPLVIGLFYSGRFAGSIDPLRWICLGMALRVVAWPMGYIILAKNARAIFLVTELAATVVHVTLAWALVRRFGVVGATMAFAGLYVWHSVLIYAIVRRVTGFRWSAENQRTGLLFLFLIAIVFCACLLEPGYLGLVVGVPAVGLASAHSLRRLYALVSFQRVPAWLRFAVRDSRERTDR